MDIGAIGNTAASALRIAEGRQPMPFLQNIPSSSSPVQTTNAVQQVANSPSLDQVKQAVDSINHSMQSLTRGLEFSVDEESERVVVKVIDPATKELIRQIPSDETLAIARSLDQVIGRLVREVA